jgi:hypothetical protein
MRPLKTLEHCAQKWAPVLRKNNATTQGFRAFLRFRLKAKRSKQMLQIFAD